MSKSTCRNYRLQFEDPPTIFKNRDTGKYDKGELYTPKNTLTEILQTSVCATDTGQTNAHSFESGSMGDLTSYGVER